MKTHTIVVRVSGPDNLTPNGARLAVTNAMAIAENDAQETVRNDEEGDEGFLDAHTFLQLSMSIELPAFNRMIDVILPPPPAQPTRVVGACLTKRQVRILRGHVAKYGRSQYDLAHAGSQPPEDAEDLRRWADEDRERLFEYIKTLQREDGK